MRNYFVLILIVLFASCVRNKQGQVIPNQTPIQTPTVTSSKVFEVAEVTQTSKYTYLKVKENMSERWVAVTRQEIAPGDVFYYDKALQMSNFKSKELDRTFEIIYFINQISKNPIGQSSMGAMPAHSGKVGAQSAKVNLEKSEGELTVAQVFENKQTYAVEEFEIQGIVVKVNKQVMGRNWIHIQDGTNDNGNFDLTITSQDLVNVGDEVTFKGKLTLNKNFGSGYFYDVIMENGELVSKPVI